LKLIYFDRPERAGWQAFLATVAQGRFDEGRFGDIYFNDGVGLAFLASFAGIAGLANLPIDNGFGQGIGSGVMV
jgi:hypothetical protein